MSEHDFSSLMSERNALMGAIQQMGEQVNNQLGRAVDSLLNSDKALAIACIEADQQINDMQVKIQEMAQNILALRAPMAENLRAVITAFQVATNLERAGDMAKNIARTAKKNVPEIDAETAAQLREMTQLASANLSLALKAYEKFDVDLASESHQSDKQIDLLHKKLSKSLMAAIISHEDDAEAKTRLLNIGHAIERVGDHAKNIAEAAIYGATGEMNKSDMFDDQED